MAELRVVENYPLQECTTCHYTWMSDDETCPRCLFEPEGHDPSRAMLINWEEFWQREQATEEWSIWPIVPAGRGVALFAPAKEGKSLIVQVLAIPAAIGLPGLDRVARPPIDILYLDYEMTLDDLQERLEDSGYGPTTDLSRLHWASLPSLPPLNTPEGAKAVMGLVESTGAKLVIIDTFGRAVEGEENSNDVAQDFYRWTGLALKSTGIGYLRTDHSGKDPVKGQRGGSAKNDDVDVVWRLGRIEGGVVLKATHRRIGWVPETVQLQVYEDPWRLSVVNDAASYPAGTKETADLLDRLQVSDGASFSTANTAIKAADQEGKGRRRAVVMAAQRYRRDQIHELMTSPRNPGTPPGTPSSRQLREQGSGTETSNGSHAGAEPVPEQAGTIDPDVEGRRFHLLGGTGVPVPPPQPPEEDIECPF